MFIAASGCVLSAIDKLEPMVFPSQILAPLPACGCRLDKRRRSKKRSCVPFVIGAAVVE
jgi:hypothetical protein